MAFPWERWAGQGLIRMDILGPGLRHHVVGQARGRARLVPARGVEPVADILLVERGLGAAGLISVLRPVARAGGREGLVDQEELAGCWGQAERRLSVGEDVTPG